MALNILSITLHVMYV